MDSSRAVKAIFLYSIFLTNLLNKSFVLFLFDETWKVFTFVEGKIYNLTKNT
jgi:hypothetical protein